MKSYTALVRDKVTRKYEVRRTTECANMKSFSEELRKNGFAVCKVFRGNISDETVAIWALYNSSIKLISVE